VLGCRKRYYADTGEDALILWKNHLQQEVAAASQPTDESNG
jgi:hypothetical protein